jgi:hypothetical protein
MSVTPEMLYFQLGSLAVETPELATGPITREQKEWIERAAALVDLACGLAEKIQFAMVVKNLTGELRARHAETIASICPRRAGQGRARRADLVAGDVHNCGQLLRGRRGGASSSPYCQNRCAIRRPRW